MRSRVGLLTLTLAVLLAQGCASNPINRAIMAGQTPDESLIRAARAAGQIDQIDRHGETSLLKAVALGNESAARQLLAAGANPDRTGKGKDTPLVHAILKRDLDIVKLLVNGGASTDLPNSNGLPPLGAAAIYGDAKTAAFLIGLGIDVNKTYSTLDANSVRSLHSPLLDAVIAQNIEVVALLLGAGADPNVDLNSTANPLIESIAIDNNELALMLLEHGASANSSVKTGSALDFAALKGNYEVAQELLSRSADPNFKHRVQLVDKSWANYTPLVFALISPHKQRARVVELLLDRGADPSLEVSDEVGRYRALHIAAGRNDRESARLLLAFGADRQALNSALQTPGEYAQTLRNGAFARILDGSVRVEDDVRRYPRYTASEDVAIKAEPIKVIAPSGRRVALVIGNSAYLHTRKLVNAASDARTIGATLNRLGFEVTTAIDQDRNAMERALRSFGDRLPGAEVALFYYAGHGLQIDGHNYLLPVSAKLSKRRDLKYEAISLDAVMDELGANAGMNLVILDACRDNPLSRNLAMGAGRSVSASRGLAIPRTSSVGTLIAYATSPNATAADGIGRHSPYTTALIRWIGEPGLEIKEVFQRVRSDVINKTAGAQVPWENSSLVGGGIYLGGR